MSTYLGSDSSGGCTGDPRSSLAVYSRSVAVPGGMATPDTHNPSLSHDCGRPASSTGVDRGQQVYRVSYCVDFFGSLTAGTPIDSQADKVLDNKWYGHDHLLPGVRLNR